NILLHAAAEDADLRINDDVLSNNGHISLLADRDIITAPATSVSTDSTGTIDMAAANGSITIGLTATVISDEGDIRLLAETDIVLAGSITAANANVGLIANTGSILDGDSDHSIDVTAIGLRMVAADSIGLLGDDLN